MSIAADTADSSKGHPAFDPGKVLEGLFASAVLFVASGAVFPLLRRPHGEGTVTVSEGGPEGQIYAVAFAVVAVLLIPQWKRFISLVRADWTLWLLPALAFASFAWSTDRSLTFRGSVMLTGSMLFGAYLVLRFDAGEQLTVLALTLGLAVVSSLALAMVDPSLGIEAGAHAGDWRGIFAHKNMFGRVMVLALTVFAILWTYRPQSRVYSSVFAVAALLLTILSHSRTSLAAAGCLMAFIAARPILRRVRASAWLVGSLFAAVLVGLGVLAWSQRSGIIVRDVGAETLTGRTVLWAASLLKFAERPLLGYGYRAFWGGRSGDYMDVWRLVNWDPANSHNAFLDVALDLGVVGLLLFLLVCVRMLTRALALYRRPELTGSEQLWPSTVMVFTILSYMTEGQLLQNHAYWMLYTMAALLTVKYSVPEHQANQRGDLPFSPSRARLPERPIIEAPT